MTNRKDHRFQAAQSLHQLLPRLDRLMREIDRKAGATGAQLSALAAISEAEQDRLHLLAAHEGVSKPTMSRIVTALISKGWVKKRLDPSDERMPILVVTRDGHDTLAKCCDARTTALIELFGEVGLDTCAITHQAFRAIAKAISQS